MEILWRSAEVDLRKDHDGLYLSVVIKGGTNQGHLRAFARNAAREQATESRTTIWQTGVPRDYLATDTWSLFVHPVDADDIEGERKWVESFIAAVDAAAPAEQRMVETEYRQKFGAR